MIKYIIKDQESNDHVVQIFMNENDNEPLLEIYSDGEVYDVKNGKILETEYLIN